MRVQGSGFRVEVLRLSGVRVREAGEVLVLEACAFRLSGFELVKQVMSTPSTCGC